MFLAAAPNPEIKPVGKRVDHRDADAVQAAGHLIGVLIEFSAGVQLGHDHFRRRHAFLGVDVDRNAATVVGDADATVAIERYLDEIAIAGQRFVDGVVDHLVDHVVQARAIVGIADVHAGPLPDGVQSAQHLDLFGAVFERAVGGGLIVGGGGRGLIAHVMFAFALSVVSFGFIDGGVGDPEKPGPATHAVEQFRIGASHPDLGAETTKNIEQGAAPVGVEMRRDFVQQQHRPALGGGLHPGMRQNQGNHQRFLLAG